MSNTKFTEKLAKIVRKLFSSNSNRDKTSRICVSEEVWNAAVLDLQADSNKTIVFTIYGGRELRATKFISGDIFDAIYWLKKASDQNQPDAQKLLGEILLKHFKEGNKKLASEYLSKARKGFLGKIDNPDGDGVKKHAQDAKKKIENLCKDYNLILKED